MHVDRACTTFHTEDQLVITGNELNGAPERSILGGRRAIFVFWQRAAPWHSIRPRATLPMCLSWLIDEFRRLLMFFRSLDCRRLGFAPHGAPNSCVDQGAR